MWKRDCGSAGGVFQKKKSIKKASERKKTKLKHLKEIKGKQTKRDAADVDDDAAAPLLLKHGVEPYPESARQLAERQGARAVR